MNILMITPYVPFPPASGGQIRTLNLLKYLSKEHAIYLVALYKDEDQKRYVNDLRPFCKKIYLCKRPEKPWQLRNVMRAVGTWWPFLIARNLSDEAVRVVRDILQSEPIDVIHAETFYVMPHVPSDAHKPILLVDQTIEYKVYQHYIRSLPKPLEILLSLDIVKLKYWERFYWRKANVVALVSEKDEEIVKTLEPEVTTTLIPNGAGEDMLVEKPQTKQLTEPKLLFVGNFSWLQNTEAAQKLIDEVFPIILKYVPDAQLIVAGQHAAEKLKHGVSKHIQIVDIAYHDNTTMVDLYKTSTLFVSPIYGAGGTRLKILAAMAAGLPVVGTNISLDGLDAEDGVHALIAEDAQTFATQITRILSDPKLFKSIQHHAHALVMERYSFRAITKKLIEVYESIVRK